MDLSTAINKPPNISSAQVLRDLQTHFNPSKLFAPSLDRMRSERSIEPRNQRNRRSWAKKAIQVKLGHGGTLDPLATGVLIVGVGSGTKTLASFLGCGKSYTTDVLFGAATDTYDILGRVISRKGWDHLTKDGVEEALIGFRGKGKQRPPIYSALKMDGKKLYEYAREGKKPPMDIQERDVDVEELEMKEWIEGGRHGFKIPEGEADKMEREVLNKMIHPNSKDLADRPRRSTKSEEAAAGKLSAAAGSKRKHDDRTDDAVVESSKPTVRRLDSPEPTMSGALSENLAKEAEASMLGESEGGVKLDQLEADIKQSIEAGAATSSPPVAKLRMSVGSGFYVRTLCQDLGEEVDSAAMMASLVRTRQGQFELGKNVFEYSDLAKGEDVWGPQIQRLLGEWNKSKEPPQGQ